MFKPVKSDVNGNIEVTAKMSEMRLVSAIQQILFFCFRDCRRSLTLHETASRHCRVLLTVRLLRVQAKEVNRAPWPCCG